MTERGRVGESHILQMFLLCANRHCEEQSERSNPYFLRCPMDCFAALAMTGKALV
jgi:hypothetical protein